MGDCAEVGHGSVLQVCDIDCKVLATLLARFELELVLLPHAAAIDGSYWGEPEAGITGCRVHVRPDTPVHSLLHETCHAICMTADRRAALHTDAGGDDLEESAVCYLQIILAGFLPGVGRQRLMQDMDAWGYSFRLGSTANWFERDASDARDWLEKAGLLAPDGEPSWVLRQA
jgi:hypothetical protein